MTATAASLRPAPATPARTVSLRLVPGARGASSAPRAPFVAVVVGLLALGLLVLLGLNTVLAQDAFRLHELRVQGKQLADREQALMTEVERLQAPRAIAERAAAQGMLPGGPPAFLRLPDGAVLGEGAAALAPQPDLVGDSAVPPAAVPDAEAQTEQAADAQPGGADATTATGGTR